MTEQKFDCPFCGQSLEAASDMQGTPIDCPSCKRPILIPKKDRKAWTMIEGGLIGGVIMTVIVLTMVVTHLMHQNKSLQLVSEQRKNIPEQVVTQVAQPLPLSPLEQLVLLAKKGDAESEYDLGMKYLTGDGVPQNIQEGLRWLNMASGAGLTKAQLKLGYLLLTGTGVPRDPATAAKWFTAAAEKGSANAQNNLGVIYENGDGTTKDNSAALKYYEMAARQGDTDGAANYARLLQEVTRSAVSQWMNGNAADGSGFVPQLFFQAFHPIGTGKSIEVNDCQVKGDEVTVTCTLRWKGPIIENGYTKFRYSYYKGSGTTRSLDIIDTNGLTNDNFKKAAFAVGALVVESALSNSQ